MLIQLRCDVARRYTEEKKRFGVGRGLRCFRQSEEVGSGDEVEKVLGKLALVVQKWVDLSDVPDATTGVTPIVNVTLLLQLSCSHASEKFKLEQVLRRL